MNAANIMNSELAQTMRERMPIAEEFAYFDHAAVAPLSGRAANAMATWLQQAAEQGDALWPQWASEVENTRNLAAELLGTSSQQIALVPNTSMGINIVAHGFPWNSRDNIVTLSNEFPANQYPWMNLRDQGVEVRVVEVKDVAVDIQQILDTCDDRTRLITVSWVSFCTGYRMQLEELIAAAHARGIFVFLDAIQGIGVFPLDVEQLDVDFVAADGHKWMLGPEGAGIFYLKQSHLDLLRPVMVGWNSVKRPFDFDQINWQPRPTATRFEGGSNNMVGLIGLGARHRQTSRQHKRTRFCSRSCPPDVIPYCHELVCCQTRKYRSNDDRHPQQWTFDSAIKPTIQPVRSGTKAILPAVE